MQHSRYDTIDLMAFGEESRYKFLMGSVVPRPIALVTSLSASGILNAAPFSQFVVISVSPPLLGIVAHEGPHGYKDTLRNILDSGEYVINTVTEAMAHQVQECAHAYPADVSEVEKVGFHTRAALTVAPARITESPIQFECKLHKTVDFGDSEFKTFLIVGEVMMAHCADGIVAGHRVDHQMLKPLGRIAGRSYCKTGETIDV